MKHLILHEQAWDYDDLADEQITLFVAPDDFMFDIPLLKAFLDTQEGFTYVDLPDKDFLEVREPNRPKKYKNGGYIYPTTYLECLNNIDKDIRQKYIDFLETKGVKIVDYEYLIA